MLPSVLHWYLIFSVFWSARPRDVFSRNAVASYTVWITNASGQNVKREKLVQFNRRGDVLYEHKYINSTTELIDSFVYTYAPDDRPVMVNNYRTIFKYTFGQGRINRRDETDLSSKMPERHTDYIYDKMGRLLEARSQHEEDSVPYLVLKFAYDTAAHTVREEHFSEGKFFEATAYTFNEAGQLTHMETEVHGGAGKAVYDYQYNDKGLLASETASLPGKPVEYRSYEYAFFEP